MPKANGPTPIASDEDYQIMLKTLEAMRAFWIQQVRESGIDEVKFSRLGLVAITQWASIVAVDLGMSHEQFSAVCQANYKTSYAKAPRFI